MPSHNWTPRAEGGAGTSRAERPPRFHFTHHRFRHARDHTHIPAIPAAFRADARRAAASADDYHRPGIPPQDELPVPGEESDLGVGRLAEPRAARDARRKQIAARRHLVRKLPLFVSSREVALGLRIGEEEKRLAGDDTFPIPDLDEGNETLDVNWNSSKS